MEEGIFYVALENFRNALGDFIDACIDHDLDPEEEVENEVNDFWDLWHNKEI